MKHIYNLEPKSCLHSLPQHRISVKWLSVKMVCSLPLAVAAASHFASEGLHEIKVETLTGKKAHSKFRIFSLSGSWFEQAQHPQRLPKGL